MAAACALLPPVIARAETADEFVARLNKQFAELGVEINAAGWTQATYINVDTELLSAKATEHYLAAFSSAVEDAKKFEGQPMTAASKRSIELLKLGVSAPAPDDPAEIVLRLSVKDSDRKKVERFGREMAPLVTAGPAGVTGFAGGRPKAQEIVAYWPALLPRELVSWQVSVASV